VINKNVFLFVILMLSYSAKASELNFKFKNPAFSGVNYSSHVFAIEQVEEQRKQ